MKHTNCPVKGRQIDTRRINDVDDLYACHLLFVDSSEQERLWKIFTSSREANVLTVGDMDDFVELGGVINLTKGANKIGFKINLAAATQAQLKLDLKLLKLANSVIRN